VGHQAAALLGLVESLRAAIHARRAGPAEQRAWSLWERWISEIVADFWSVAKIGIGSTIGLIGVVSLPTWFVFRLNVDDPHPMPWMRVRLSCAIGDALYPHPQWRGLAALWESLYPRDGLDAARRQLLAALEATAPAFVALLADHRPRSLGGRSLRDVMPLGEREPSRLVQLWESFRRHRGEIRDVAPSIAFAVLGQARAIGELTAETEGRTVESLLTYWALRSTLDAGELAASLNTAQPIQPLLPAAA
jgi:hypothetical protein